MKTNFLLTLILFCIQSGIEAQEIFCGENHSLLLCQSGVLFGFGDNGSGQLATGDYMYQPTPILIQGLPPIMHAAGGGFHTLAVSNEGSVYAWGSGSDGQIGDGTTGNFYNTPQLVPGIDNVVQVSAGKYFSAALKSDGTVWTWGRNDSGNLGLGNYDNTLVPTQITSLSDVVRIECGNWSLFAITSNGSLYAMGDNNFATLGLGSNFPPTYNTPQLVNIDNVVKVEAGYWNVMALKGDNSVWVWGDDSSGQLGQGQSAFANSPILFTGADNIIDIAAGNSFCTALDTEGNVHTWGSNLYGQLGNGTDNNFSNTSTSPSDLFNIHKMACGDFHVLYLDESGNLFGCGKNDGGQLGNGTAENSSTATEGSYECIVIDNVENMESQKIQVYPNPSEDEICITSDSYRKYSSVEIYDMLGNKVHSEEIKSMAAQVNLNISHLSAGQYIIVMRSEIEIFFTELSKF